MSLSQSSLKSSLVTWMANSSGYESINDSMAAFADLYETYALNAVDISGDSPLTTFKATMFSTLNTITVNETALTAATKFANAISYFWQGATFKLLTPPAGTISPEISASVTTNLVPATLATQLNIIFSDLTSSDTIDSKATDLAQQIHTSTLTVKVTCVGTLSTSPYYLAVTGNIS